MREKLMAERDALRAYIAKHYGFSGQLAFAQYA